MVGFWQHLKANIMKNELTINNRSDGRVSVLKNFPNLLSSKIGGAAGATDFVVASKVV